MFWIKLIAQMFALLILPLILAAIIPPIAVYAVEALVILYIHGELS